MGRTAWRVAAGAGAYLGLCWAGGALGWGITPYDLAQAGVLIPLFAGLMFGPVAGFGVGVAGYLVSYLALFGPPGLLPLPAGELPADGMALWVGPNALAAGLVGAAAGRGAAPGRRYASPRPLLRAAAVAVLAIVGGTAFLVVVAPATAPAAARAHPPFGVDAAALDALMAVVVLPVLLFNASQPRVRPTDWLRSRFARRLAGLVLLAAALPLLLVLFLLRQHLSGAVWVQVGLTLALALAFTVVNAGLAAHAFALPLVRLTRAARAMRDGALGGAEVAALKATTGDDEVSVLGQVFGEMAEEVIRREEALRRQVAHFHVEVDEAHRDAQVAEITDTAYFRELREHAARLRRPGRDAESGPG